MKMWLNIERNFSSFDENSTGWHCERCRSFNKDSSGGCHRCGAMGSDALVWAFSTCETVCVPEFDTVVPKIPDDKCTELRICVVGKTGSGKSSLVNSVFSRDVFRSECSASSVTKQCQHVTGYVCGRKVTAVDTPGVFDTELTSEYKEREIIKCAVILAPGPHAILLVIKIGRFTEEQLLTVSQLKNAFGTNMVSRLIVVFTGKDELRNKTIEQYLERAPEALVLLLNECGQRFIAFDNTAKEENNKEQVERLMNMIERLANSNHNEYYSSRIFGEADDVMKELRLEYIAKTNKLIDDAETRTECEHHKNLEMLDKRNEAIANEITQIHFENDENQGQLESILQIYKETDLCDAECRTFQIKCERLKNEQRNRSESLWRKLDMLYIEKRTIAKDREIQISKMERFLKEREEEHKKLLWIQVGEILRNSIEDEHVFRKLRQRMHWLCKRMKRAVTKVFD